MENYKVGDLVVVTDQSNFFKDAIFEIIGIYNGTASLKLAPDHNQGRSFEKLHRYIQIHLFFHKFEPYNASEINFIE